MVLVGEKRAVFQFNSVTVGLVVIGLFSAFSLHRSRKRGISSKAGTNGLNSFVVDVSNFSGTALILTVLLLFLFLLQEIFFQRERFNALVVGQRICGNVGGIKSSGGKKNTFYLQFTIFILLYLCTKLKVNMFYQH